MRGGRDHGRGRARAAVLASSSGVLTAVGHLAGGGTLPELAILLVLLPLLAGVFVSLAERSRSTPGTIATLAAGQVALHHLMVLLHPLHGTGPAAVTGAAMPVLHAAVTLVTALALRHADRAVSALFAGMRRVLPRRLTFPAAQLGERPCPTPAHNDLPARLALLCASADPRRGPPVWC